MYLGTQECDVIVVSGALPFLYVGWDRTQNMMRELRQAIGIPIILDLEATFEAFRALSVKKIVMASPFEEERNEERKKILEGNGFEVLHMKGLGIRRRLDVQKQSPYASYRLAKQVFLEAPDAEAIYIACPDWPTVHNIEKLELDVGRSVVTHVTACNRAALSGD
jgi:maleate isomerase